MEEKIDIALRTNKWDGEDEDEEDIKDSWEDFDEEKKDVEKPAEAPKPKPKPKKTLADKIEQREKQARQEAEKKEKEKEAVLTPEERRAEMLRRQKLQEESDLRLAMETFGITPGQGIDAMNPNSPEEFEEFRKNLVQKINSFNKHDDFPLFAEELIKSVAISLSSHSLKKVKTNIDNILIEKTKLEKGDKSKKKNKGKAKLRIEGENVYDQGEYNYDEYGDFM